MTSAVLNFLLTTCLLTGCSPIVVDDDSSGTASPSASSSGIPGSGGAGGAILTSTTGTGPSATTGSGSASPSTTGSGGDPPGPDEAVAYQINPAHTGAVDNDTLTPPLSVRWSRDLGAQVSYPLIAGGRVFVTVGSDTVPAKLIALDQQTGKTLWGPVELGGVHAVSYAAYEHGKVFTVNYDGQVRCYDAVTGIPQWVLQLPSNMGQFTAPPTALGGKIYIGGGYNADSVFVVSEVTGELLGQKVGKSPSSWNQPAVSSAGAFFACVCGGACNIEAPTGGEIWSPSQGCVGTGWSGTILFEGRLYLYGSEMGIAGPVFDAADGTLVGSFDATASLAFHKGRGFFFSNKVLTAKSVPSMTPLWTFAGDGTLATKPIVVNGHVYIGGTSGTVAAVDETTGVPVWSVNLDLGVPIDEGNQQDDFPRPSMAAAGGALVIPTQRFLSALW